MANRRNIYKAQALIINELASEITKASNEFARDVNPLHYFDDLAKVTQELKEIKQFITNK